MATKQDLLQAQSYSRRRLLTAFTSGIPDGIELEPRKPLGPVIGGIALAVLLVLGSMIYGLIKPGLPQGWENNKLLISRETGARFVSQNSVLYPVINTTSARLLVPSSDFQVLSVDEEKLASVERGQTIGILGAPDTLPASSHLIRQNWTSCLVNDRTLTVVHTDRNATPVDEDSAVLAQQGDKQYVLAGATRFALPEPGASRAAVLRAVGLQDAQPVNVTADWLNLFLAGDDLRPFSVPGAGANVDTPAGVFPVGAVITATGGESQDHYLVDSQGRLAPLTPIALALYQIDNSPALAQGREMSASDLSSLENADTPVAPRSWPATELSPADLSGSTACVTLQGEVDGVAQPALSRADDLTNLRTADLTKGSALLPPSGGALVRGVGAGSPDVGVISVIDSSGTAFPVPDASDETIARLGYQRSDVYPVPDAWVHLFPTGPQLTAEAAGQAPGSAGTGASGATPSQSTGASSTSAASSGAIADAASAAATGLRGTETQGQTCEPGTVVYDSATPSGLQALGYQAAARMATGRGVTVAVVDSGVDATNAHLQGALLPGVNLVPDGGPADGTGDLNGHGTAIAGIIAARQVSGSGVVGLAPESKILPVRVFRSDDDDSKRSGWGPEVDRIAEGIRYAADHGAQVINVSLSDNVGSADLLDAVRHAEAAGALVVASAGNVEQSSDGSEPKRDEVRYPAVYEEVLGVAATNADMQASDQSVMGPHVDVMAPGMNVETAAMRGGDCVYATDTPSSSFAAAYASGAAALLAQHLSQAGPAEWRYRLRLAASRADPDARDDAHGWGFVRPVEAMSMVIDTGVRGPLRDGVAPYEPQAAVYPPVVADETPDPIIATQTVVMWAAIGAGVAFTVLGLLVQSRRRRDRELSGLWSTEWDAASTADGSHGGGAAGKRRQTGAEERR